MFSDGDDNQGMVLGVVFSVIALVIALVIGLGIYKTRPIRLTTHGAMAMPAGTARVAVEPALVAPGTPEPGRVALEVASVKIYFYRGETSLPPGASEALSSLAQEVVAGKRLAVGGYYDASGDAARNSEVTTRQRATNVRNLLASLGVPPDKIEMLNLRGIAEAGADERVSRIEVNVR